MSHLLRIQQVSERLQASKSKVYRLVKAGDIAAPLKIGGMSRWLSDDIEKYIHSIVESARS